MGYERISDVGAIASSSRLPLIQGVTSLDVAFANDTMIKTVNDIYAFALMLPNLEEIGLTHVRGAYTNPLCFVIGTCRWNALEDL